MGAKEKRIVARLEQIKQRAAEMNAQQTTRSSMEMGSDLAEEAAGLGLELAALLTDKKGKA